jgi:hypothetical protein
VDGGAKTLSLLYKGKYIFRAKNALLIFPLNHLPVGYVIFG